MSDTTKQPSEVVNAEAKTTESQVAAPSEHTEHAKKEEPKTTTGSSAFPVDPQFVKTEQFKMPTWGLLSVLILGFFILKFFIYIKDTKRHGK